MARLTKEAILTALERKTKDVPIPELGGDVFLLEFDGNVRMEMEGKFAEAQKSRDLTSFLAWLVQQSVVDDNRQPMFTSTEVATLAKRSPSGLERICRHIRSLNGMNVSDIKEAEKNSESAPS